MGSSTTIGQKIKKFLVALVILVPIIAVALWFLFPEPDLKFVTEASSNILLQQENTPANSVLQKTKSIILSHGSLEGVNADTITNLNYLATITQEGLESLSFIHKNSLFLIKTENVKDLVKQAKLAKDLLDSNIEICANYLKNNFEPHLQSTGVTGATVNDYFVTYNKIFSDYAVAEAKFNKAALEVLKDAGTRTVELNTLSVAAYKIKVEWELLCVNELNKTIPNENISTIYNNLIAYNSQSYFGSNYSIGFRDEILSNNVSAFSNRNDLIGALTAFSTPAQSAFLDTLEATDKTAMQQYFVDIMALDIEE
ncbi:MAG: hypothetical protein WCR30_04840 [Clostridia bacterium]